MTLLEEQLTKENHELRERIKGYVAAEKMHIDHIVELRNEIKALKSSK